MATIRSFLTRMFVLCVLAIILIVFATRFFYQKMVEQAADTSKLFVVSKIVDGETLELENGDKVRMIGYKIPRVGDKKPAEMGRDRMWYDSMFIGKNSSAAKGFLMDRTKGKTVQLQFDPATESTNYRDKKGRLLAYVWLRELELSVEQDWLVADMDRHPYGYPVLLNACMVRGGYGYTDESMPWDYVREFRMLQNEAAQSGRGIWAGAAPAAEQEDEF